MNATELLAAYNNLVAANLAAYEADRKYDRTAHAYVNAQAKYGVGELVKWRGQSGVVMQREVRYHRATSFVVYYTVRRANYKGQPGAYNLHHEAIPEDELNSATL